jgi:hypothetical protein
MLRRHKQPGLRHIEKIKELARLHVPVRLPDDMGHAKTYASLQ